MGTIFTIQETKQFAEDFGIKLLNSTPYYAQAIIPATAGEGGSRQTFSELCFLSRSYPGSVPSSCYEKRVWFEAVLVMQPVVVAAVSMCFTQEELYKMMNVGILSPTNPCGILLPRGILPAHSNDEDHVQLVGHDEVTRGGEFGHDSDYSDDKVGQTVSVGNPDRA
ncbi:hypothetical protein HHK36_008713 [Tetracentron sinense]|uniref:Uncharacterized protein n=1 Tax=Tetracentron sinense TaxID=13715 RepID=A0A835DJK4_TETSI|nr:hypothetical protein HHK36_008713 [Tetracentron sinense]